MSAKEANKRPTGIPIVALPDELLLEVLRHATWVPYGIAPSDLVVKSLQSTEVGRLEKEYRQSLVTKRFLIRVCKRWYRLAYLFLYEWILVARTKNILGLVRAAEQLSGGSSTLPAYIGWHTKRLDIDLHRTGCEPQNELDDIGPLLLRLLLALNNLEVLTIGQCEGQATFMDPSVSDSWCQKLQFLNWRNERHLFDAAFWSPFIHSHPNLIGINTSPTLRYYCSRDPMSIPFTHSRLLTWTTDFFSPVPIASTFTSLHRLSLNIRMSDVLGSERAEHLLAWPIPSLTDLQINFVGFRGSVDEDLDQVEETFQPLYQLMPNLRRVELVFSLWPSGWSGCTFPEGVAELGIRVCSVRPTRQLARKFLKVLGEVVQKAHGPPMIQFLDRGTLSGILMHTEYLVRHAKEWNLLERWVDHEGHEYHLPVQ